MPDAATLAQRLRDRIRLEGPLRFDTWMEACLYDPAGGFYARGARIGREGTFATAATLHPAFADAILTEVAGYETVVEFGPGDGSLAERMWGHGRGSIDWLSGSSRGGRKRTSPMPSPWPSPWPAPWPDD